MEREERREGGKEGDRNGVGGGERAIEGGRVKWSWRGRERERRRKT